MVLEVGGDPDMRTPGGSQRKEKKKEEWRAGPAARLGGPRKLVALLASCWAAGGREWEKRGGQRACSAVWAEEGRKVEQATRGCWASRADGPCWR
jgi:hypothetical protein